MEVAVEIRVGMEDEVITGVEVFTEAGICAIEEMDDEPCTLDEDNELVDGKETRVMEDIVVVDVAEDSKVHKDFPDMELSVVTEGIEIGMDVDKLGTRAETGSEMLT